MSGNSKVAKKEGFLNKLLLLLVLISIALTGNVWFQEKLWPSGYNFFSSLPKNSFSIPKENLSRPQKIVLNSDSKRTVLYTTSRQYEKVMEVLRNDISDIFRRSDNMLISHKVVNDDVFYRSLKSPSIFIDYQVVLSPRLWGQLIGIREPWLQDYIGAMKNLLFIYGDDYVICHVRDYKNQTLHEFVLNYPTAMLDIINDYSDESAYYFSFELNLDKKLVNPEDSELKVPQNVFVDPLVLVPLGRVETSVIDSVNPMDIYVADAIVDKFGFTTQSGTRYTDANGTRMYVETYSTIRIYSNGLIEYECFAPERGVGLITAGSTLFESLNASIEFSEKIWNEASPGQPLNALVTSNLTENQPETSSYTLTLDYYFQGIPIIVDLPGDLYEPMNHAIEIEISNGIITKYRQLVRTFSSTDEVDNNSTMLDALAMYRPNFDTEVKLRRVFLGYLESGDTGKRKANWFFTI